MAAFPTHVWTIILFLQDYSWVVERNNQWDAIGVGAYGLIVAFVESIFVFVVALLLSFLVSRCWDESRRVTLLSVLIFLIAVWAIVNQLYFWLGLSIPGNLFQVLINSTRPLRTLYALCFGLVFPTVLLPTYLILKSEKAHSVAQNLIERISTLTAIYLFLDLCSVVIILIRNL